MNGLNTNDPASLRSFELGLLGHPVSHSLSPVMHAAALEACGLAGRYVALDVPDVSDLLVQLQRLRSGELHGLNVTIPWKIEAAKGCDALVDAAQVIGAANTLKLADDGRLLGFNTDVHGLECAIREAFPDLVAHGRVAAVLGAGGAGRSAILAANNLGFDVIRVHNRTHEAALAVTQALGRGSAVATVADALDGACLVIQASAAGFRLDPEASQRLADDLAPAMALTAPDASLYDAIYAPRLTAWMIAAQRNGRRASDGLGMLVHQAALAFEIWTGKRPPLGPMMDAALQHLRI